MTGPETLWMIGAMFTFGFIPVKQKGILSILMNLLLSIGCLIAWPAVIGYYIHEKLFVETF